MSENCPEENGPPIAAEITANGVEYVMYLEEKDYGLCWCTDGQHRHHAQKDHGYGPIWCGSQRNLRWYELTVLTERARATRHRISRRHLMYVSAPEEEAR
mgnify:CR=1 FL=1